MKSLILILLLMFAERAEDVKPLEVGASIPAVTVRSVSGQEVSLQSAVAGKPTLLIFYRGGWCPYCNTQLGSLSEIESELSSLGVQILALSPDKSEKLSTSLEKNKLSYTLLSDSKASAMEAFGIAFKVEDSLVEKYKTEYKIDIEADSGETHHLLPVPAAFLFGTDGKLKYRYFNADYKVRVSSKELLEEARKLK